MSQLVLAILVLVLGGVVAAPVLAQTELLNDPQNGVDDSTRLVAQKLDPESRQKESVDKAAATRQAPAQITDQRRNELMRFVRANHPELERLINSLRKQRPAEYQSALRYLDRSVTNLASYKQTQSEERYNQLLEDWKLKSRIMVLSAQLSITDTPARRKQLQQLITRQLDNRYRQLKSDAERFKNRLDRLNEEIARIEADRAEIVQRQMDSVIKTSQRINAARARQAKQNQAANKKNEPANKPDSSGSKKKNETDKNDKAGELR
jgi:hypothetical protein